MSMSTVVLSSAPFFRIPFFPRARPIFFRPDVIVFFAFLIFGIFWDGDHTWHTRLDGYSPRKAFVRVDLGVWVGWVPTTHKFSSPTPGQSVMKRNILVDGYGQPALARRLRDAMPPPAREVKRLTRLYLDLDRDGLWRRRERLDPWYRICRLCIGDWAKSSGSIPRDGVLRIELLYNHHQHDAIASWEGIRGILTIEP